MVVCLKAILKRKNFTTNIVIYDQSPNFNALIYFQEKKETEPKEETEAKKEENATNGNYEKEKEEEVEGDSTNKETVLLSEREKATVVDDNPTFDIEKVLAETSVPELSSDIESVVKKSVKFSPNISKEIALKTIRVMQPESNLLDPQDVDDEFAFTEEPR